MRLIPPLAVPITLADLYITIKALFTSHDYDQILKQAIRDHFNVRFTYSISSGRAALYIILKSLQRLSTKNEVIVPAYTCPSVIQSVTRAGCKVVLCDVGKGSFVFDVIDLKKKVNINTLAIIPCYLFGIPFNIEYLLEIGNKKNIFIIEDAAQAMGAKVDNSFVGTIGDIGFFSLGKGKVITTVNGGIILTNNEKIAREVENNLKDVGVCNLFDNIYYLFLIMLYTILLNPPIYGFLTSLRVNLIKETYKDFNIKKLTNIQSALGVSMLSRLEKINSNRKRNAESLLKKLLNIKGILLSEIDQNTYSVYLRLPVFVTTVYRDEIYKRLKENGIGVSKVYDHPIYKKRYFKDLEFDMVMQHVETISKRLLALPTNHFIKESDNIIIRNIFMEYE